MNVFKFGGASINSLERIKKVAEIIIGSKEENLVIVISAMGKTTNALEKVAEAFFNGNTEEAFRLFNHIKQLHIDIAGLILEKNPGETLDQLNNFFTEVEWLLHDKPVKSYDYYYDQIVCIGELLSSCIVSAYLNEAGVTNQWIDVRDLILTDNKFREAGVDLKISEQKIVSTIKNGNYITQGFIGCTDENESTTLGREGSDYTAAVFSNLLNADSLTIWKDVEGVMNTDPDLFAHAQLIKELSYNEAIEMAYYGAQVIHPKTIKPLQNKNIPLYVKSFIEPLTGGTVVSNKQVHLQLPIIILKHNQALLHMNTYDFSFVEEEHMIGVYGILNEMQLKPNLIQKGAISLQICIDDHVTKVEQLSLLSGTLFEVQLQRGLTLLTIRHYDEYLFDKLVKEKEVVLKQQTKEMIQVLYR